MTDDADTGHLPIPEAGAGTARLLAPGAGPTVLVFADVASLADSLGHEGPAHAVGRPALATERGLTATPEPAASAGPNGRGVAPVAAPAAVEAPVPQEVVTDEQRTRYGLLLDSAAERGLLDPTDYEIRLRELAQATSTAQMVELVAELPAFAPAGPTSTPTRSRRAIQSANRADAAGAAASQRRRMVMWLLMGLLVVVAVASLIILALSAERLSRNRNSSPPPAPVATQPVSALHL